MIFFHYFDQSQPQNSPSEAINYLHQGRKFCYTLNRLLKCLSFEVIAPLLIPLNNRKKKQRKKKTKKKTINRQKEKC